MSGARNLLAIHLNGHEILCYDRSEGVPGRRRQFLEQMDRDMDAGIRLDGETLTGPEPGQRARYVAMHLLRALDGNNRALARTLCAWLATRVPELRAVRATEEDGMVSLEFDFCERDK